MGNPNRVLPIDQFKCREKAPGSALYPLLVTRVATMEVCADRHNVMIGNRSLNKVLLYLVR